MLSVEEALETILARTPTLPAERIPLLEALGRVLAEDIVADIAMPPFDNSAVDGYAVRAEDTIGAGPQTPVVLRIVADIPAGTVSETPIVPGTAARIMTGAPVPTGADAIVMVEDTRPLEGERVAILEAVKQGWYVRLTGEDVPRGAVVLEAGTRIRAAEVAMLATLGRAFVSTVRPARVAVVSTGDELVAVEEGVIPPPGKIRDSNRYALAALVRESGAEVHSLTHIPDEPAATEATLRACADPASGADVIVTAGGVSVGDRDFVRPALEKLGTLALWRVAMKPGKPLAFGRIGETLFFGLPGNPVSAMVTFELFVRPALWKMAGRAACELARRQVPAVLRTAIPHQPGRREYVRASTTVEGERFVTQPTGAQGSGILRSMTLANSLIVLPTESTGAAAGETVKVLLLE
jgi:molybdopterin molybdotransferase